MIALRDMVAVGMAVVAACKPVDRSDQSASSIPPDTTTVEVFDTSASTTTATPAVPATTPASKVLAIDGFLTPESVLHDPAQDIYFVSNINGSATGKDNNGFISRVRTDGAVENLKFIEGSRNNVTLHAPKGLAVLGDTLWVTDIDVVRGFNRRSGTPVASVDMEAPARNVTASSSRLAMRL